MTSSANTSLANAMDTLSLTLTNTRVIDGIIYAANSAGISPEAYAEWLLTQDGHRFADANNYGVITSAAFVARFTPTEYGNILAAAGNTVEVPDPIPGVPTAEQQQAYDDMVAAYALLENPTLDDTNMYQAVLASYAAATAPTNQAEIDAAEAQNAEANEIKALLDGLFSAPLVPLDDQRVVGGLQLLVSRGLLDAARPAEILFYARPFPQVNDTTDPDGGGSALLLAGGDV